MNSHDGPHDGTGTIPEAIDEASKWLIPVFAAGNEGMDDIHASHTFGTDNSVLRLLLPCFNSDSDDDDDDDDDDEYNLESLKGDDGDEDDKKAKANTETGVTGITRLPVNEKDQASVEVILIDKETGENLWSSTPLDMRGDSQDLEILASSSEFDDKLAKYFQGTVSMGGRIQPNGKMYFEVLIKGDLDDPGHIFSFVTKSTDNIAFDFWEKSEKGFESTQLEGFTKGDNLMSAGDWSSTASAVSVGAYANNAETRTYSGIVSEMKKCLILCLCLATAWKHLHLSPASVNSLMGTVSLLSALLHNIVSSWNHYNCQDEILESMQWQGYPYGASSGTSQATPIVSGIIACWLQANPMTVSDIKPLISQTSRHDEFSPSSTGEGTGIDAAVGIEYIPGQTNSIPPSATFQLLTASTICRVAASSSLAVASIFRMATRS